ncbi:MAG: MFS transporter [Rhodospirillales bacterium]|nr:MFS transporter [Rhodospirillales bacterium]
MPSEPIGPQPAARRPTRLPAARPRWRVGAGAVPQSDFGRWAAAIVLLAGGFLPPVDFFIVNVALPSIHADLGATPAETQLVISAYAVGYAVFLITGGRLGDLYGRRRMFLAGMTAFTLANLICGAAPSPGLLLVGRVLQGLSASMLIPQVLASLRALFADERALARAMSAYGIMMGLAAAIGQFAGGALVQWNPFDWGWRAVFLLKLPICATTLAAAWVLMPETGGRGGTRLDIGGAALVSLMLACVVVPLSKGRELGWPLWIFGLLALTPVLAAVFLWYEDRLAQRGGLPLVDPGLLAVPGFRRGVLVGTLFFFTTAFYFLFGIYHQEGRGVLPLQTGLAIVPYGVGLFLGPVLSAPLQRLRPKLLALGMAVQVTGYGLIGLLVWAGIGGAALSAVVFLAGFGQGVAFPRLFNTVLADVPAAQAGVAAGILNSALQVGAAVSAAAIGSLFFAVLDGRAGERAFAEAFATAQWTVTGALAVAMLIAIPPRQHNRPKQV